MSARHMNRSAIQIGFQNQRFTLDKKAFVAQYNGVYLSRAAAIRDRIRFAEQCTIWLV